MTDYSEEQRNELEALESIYPDSFTGERAAGPAPGRAGPGPQAVGQGGVREEGKASAGAVATPGPPGLLQASPCSQLRGWDVFRLFFFSFLSCFFANQSA